jgi:hypothetical protein
MPDSVARHVLTRSRRRVGGIATSPSWSQRSGLGQLARALCVSSIVPVMKKIRSPWLPVFAGVMLIVLSLSTALAGKPSGTNHGQQVSSDARAQAGTEKSDNNTQNSSSNNHGACVSAVAQSDAVGGKNHNHGGAVSEAARNTCANDHSANKPETKGSAESQDASESEAPESESEAESPGT